MKSNVRKEADLKHAATGAHLELDIWLPSLNLAFEYQVLWMLSSPTCVTHPPIPLLIKERHHYVTADYTYATIDSIEGRDRVKRELVAAKGLTLLTIPCWWDGRVER